MGVALDGAVDPQSKIDGAKKKRGKEKTEQRKNPAEHLGCYGGAGTEKRPSVYFWGDDRYQANTDCNPQLGMSGSHMAPKLSLTHDDTHFSWNVQ
jgi:hypothetical protein